MSTVNLFPLVRVYLDGLGYAARNDAALKPLTIREATKRHDRAKIIAALLSALEIHPTTQWGADHWFDRRHLERLYIDIGKRRGIIQAHGSVLSTLNLSLETGIDPIRGEVWRCHPDAIDAALEDSEKAYQTEKPQSGYVPNPSEIALFSLGIVARPHL
jgi:hypothetical protein